MPLNFKLKPQGDNDIVLARFVSLDNSRLLEPSSHTNQIKIDLHPSFEKGEYIAISNCQQMTLSHYRKRLSIDPLSLSSNTLSNHLTQAFTKIAKSESKSRLFVIQRPLGKIKMVNLLMLYIGLMEPDVKQNWLMIFQR